jgi:hypothetical protein
VYKYFHHSKRYLQTLFKLRSENLRGASESLFASFSSLTPNASYRLVSVSVRIGDIHWTLNNDYYFKAFKILKERFQHLVIVFFVGGSGENKKETMEDRSLVVNTLMKNASDERTIVTMVPHNVSNFVVFETMSKFDVMVISSSSFSWWSAYLSNSSLVIAPRQIHHKTKHFVAQDYYPPEWILLESKQSANSSSGGGEDETALPGTASTNVSNILEVQQCICHFI